jgi:Fanconi anemia group M protein
MLYGPATKTELLKLQKNIMGTISRGNHNWNYFLGASSCAQAVKIQHALELLETQTLLGFNKYLKELIEQARMKKSKGVEKLVRKNEFNFIHEQSNELLAKNFEHPKVEEIIKIIHLEIEKNPKEKIIIFTQFRETSSIVSERLNKIPGIRSKMFVGQAKKNGSGLSQKDQKKIIEEFSRGEINVLCATCIAEEGLDIPEVNTVIFYEPVASAIRTIQRTGRTARLMKGKLIILITEKTRDESFFYVSRAREKKMKTAIENVKTKIENPVKEEIQKELKF